ncbi:hypothetical protein HAX54_002128, partial [Datura stramonium]|nr:hypothetical protein [Datura stramonium]
STGETLANREEDIQGLSPTARENQKIGVANIQPNDRNGRVADPDPRTADVFWLAPTFKWWLGTRYRRSAGHQSDFVFASAFMIKCVAGRVARSMARWS